MSGGGVGLFESGEDALAVLSPKAVTIHYKKWLAIKQRQSFLYAAASLQDFGFVREDELHRWMLFLFMSEESADLFLQVKAIDDDALHAVLNQLFH